MNRWLLSIALLVCLAGGLRAQTLDDVLAAYYQANGGLEKMQALKTLKVSGRILVSNLGAEMPVTMWMKSPAQMRSEMRIEDKLIVQACDGQNAWWIMPFIGVEKPQAMPAEQAREFRSQAEFEDPLVVWKARGWTLTLLGQETMGVTMVHKLKLVRGDGREVFLYIDIASGLELKTATVMRVNGSDTPLEIVYTDYRPVAGVLRPFKLDTLASGQLKTQLVISAWEINPEIDDVLFRMPAPGT